MRLQLVQDLLEHAATRFPEKTALVCGELRLTYGELEVRSNQFAHALIELGLCRGDRVVIHRDNSIETVLAIIAVLKAGGVFVLVNPTTPHDKLCYILRHCRASILIGGPRTRVIAQTLAARIHPQRLLAVIDCGDNTPVSDGEVVTRTFDELLVRSPVVRPMCRNVDLNLACLIYTSGSTGEPKGVMSDHSNVLFATQAIARYLELRDTDILLSASPLSFDYGLYQVFLTFTCGGTLVLEQSFTYPADVARRMAAEHVTGFAGVPTMFALLLELDLASYDLSRLRFLTNTAAALPVHHIQTIQQRFPQARLYSMYGLTETKRTLYLPPEQLDRRPGSVGIPIPGTEAWVEDEFGERCAPNQVGELVVRGRHVMRGYWEDEVASAARFRPGRIRGERHCYSGDLFRTDEEGYFYFIGRKDDIIKSRGEKVAPKEVENVLCGLDGVLEAAVIGVPDPLLGQAIKAFVVRRRMDMTEREVMGHCKRHLEDFMVPRQIEFRDELPKTSSGKIRKTELG
jgi:long-chain acyl-CoA synthetase